jgi:hypothetical protein
VRIQNFQDSSAIREAVHPDFGATMRAGRCVMKRLQRFKYEMFVRVCDFGAAHHGRQEPLVAQCGRADAYPPA